MSGITEATSNLNISAPKAKIGVIFYSTYGHITQLAEKVVEGVRAAGAEPVVYQIQETLSEEILGKMYAGTSLKPKYPIIKPNDLKELDGFLLGFPTRYGRAPAQKKKKAGSDDFVVQVSAFFDATGGLWASGALVGKFGGVFTSTAGQHGGQETTAYTTVPFFVHHGISFVPIGYVNQGLSKLDGVHGGAPWGAGTIANGDGSRQPDEVELEIAEYQGKSFASHVATFVRGKHAQAQDAAHPTAHAAAAQHTNLADLNLGAPIGAATTVQPAGTTAFKPIEEARDIKEDGYRVDEAPKETVVSAAEPAFTTPVTEAVKETEKPVASTPVVAATSTPAAAVPASNAEKITATEKPAQAAQTAPAGVTSTGKNTTATTAPKKKKAGLFAACCGKGDHIE
ncbi:hypothetical protein QFC21_005985 [Naganishia friedmannii]|uniref:Uncharacterized protein n=1 Tax=Naganishia friedmannii TaxID=89922 RepID=A0ACC2V5X5_9TREE|nr:hypothetical protein QFC21_005985 [Naganishia friedmannii]